MKYQKYPSTKILKHADVLDKLNKSSNKSLLDIPPRRLQY